MSVCVVKPIPFICVLLFVFAEFPGSFSIKFKTRSFLQQRPIEGIADFPCVADSTISECQFKIWDDLTKKNLTTVSSGNLTGEFLQFDKTVTRYKAYNMDLAAGRCGISVTGLLFRGFVIGCRIREQGKAWIYKYGTIFATSKWNIPSTLQVEPKGEVLVKSGSSVKYNCSNSPGLATYYATEERTRFVSWCENADYYQKVIDAKAVIFVHITPPTSPPLLVTSPSNLQVGVMLEATCTVGASRPPANITWYIQGHVVDDDITEVEHKDWRWSWQTHGRRQTLRRKLSSKDVGDVNVTCQATHMGLEEPLTNTKTIHVEAIETTATTQEATTTTSTTLAVSTGTDGRQGTAGQSETGYIEDKDDSTIYVIIGSAVAVLLLVVVICVVARAKHLCCFSGTNNASNKEPSVAFSASPSQPDQSQPDVVVYAQVLPREQRKNQSEPAKSSSSQSQAENMPREQRKNQSEPATSSSSQSQAENAVYAQVVPRDQRNQAERVNLDHVVYAEIVSSEPARRTTKMAPQEPEVTYTEVAFKKK